MNARFNVAPCLIALSTLVIATPAKADLVNREGEIVNLRLGQKVFVDDGTCPAGQVKLVTGSKLAATGVQATRQCVDRKGIKR